MNPFSKVLASLILVTGVAAATETSIVLKDYTARGFAPDLVSYRVAVPKGGVDRLSLQGPDGRPALLQVSAPVSNGFATISFVAELPANTGVTYRLRDDATGPRAPVTLKVTRGNEGVILENGLFSIRLPALTNQNFKEPVPANKIPAPIQAFRSGTGPWLGAGRILTTRPVYAVRVELLADGPVYATVRYELTFANGGYYRATIQVIDQVPVAKVREEFDAHELDGKDYWELSLTSGWTPDMIEIANATSGGGVELDSTAAITTLGITPDPIKPAWFIIPDSSWYAPRTMLGVFNAADRVANTNGYPVVGFVPLNKGDWRRSLGIEIHTPDSKQINLHLPMTLRHASWLREVTSETSPFSCLEHENALPTTYGRRVWGLVLAHPSTRGLAMTRGSTRGPLAAARLLYGIISLDRYKDYQLEWPDSNLTYPRVFLKPDQIPQLRKTVSQSPIATQGGQGSAFGDLKDSFVASGHDAKERFDKKLHKYLDGMTAYMLGVPDVGHHSMSGSYNNAALADDVLAWPGLSATDRAFIRAKLALITYLYMEGDLISYGAGTHTGPPNMGLAVSSSMSDFVALLPDHPMYAAWLRHASDYLTYKTGINIAPGGGWFEYGGAYHMHGFARVNNGIMGIQAAGAPGAAQLLDYDSQDWSYYMNLLSPFDSRWQSRMVPGMANSMPSHSGHYMEASGVLLEKYPELAANLRWAWIANGIGTRDINPLLERPWLQPKEPALKSEIYPGVGVIFRAHQGPDETYMFFRSGYNWSHWPEDQGHFVLYSKGAALLPFQPFQYGSSASKEFDICNLIRFGSPSNRFPHAWADANILDHAFGPTVDYAWSSVGYPDWYFSPGAKPEFISAQGLNVGTGNVRPLAPDFPQQPVPFVWDRQVLFLKGATAQAPNYFVFRDTARDTSPAHFGQPAPVASWFNLDLLGRKTDLQISGPHITADTEWPTKLDILFAQPEPVQPAFMEQNMYLSYWGGAGPTYFTDKPVSRNWVSQKDGSQFTNNAASAAGVCEQHVVARIGKAPGADYFWVAYPRAQAEQAPVVTSLKPGALKIVTGAGTDYAFLSPAPLAFADGTVVFVGNAGSVRVGKETVTLALAGGTGKVGYKGFVIEGTAPIEQTVKLTDLKPTVLKPVAAPVTVTYPPTLAKYETLAPGVRKGVEQNTEYLIDSDQAAPVTVTDGNVLIDARKAAIQITPQSVRLVALDRTYCRLSVGNVAVRGVGPFDLTFSKDKITGTVEGAIRSLVCTWPEGIIRPMYHMDGVRWYAGFADDHSISKGTTTPQLSLAFGVTDGKHQIEIAEWMYPELPPSPAQALIHW